MAMTSRLAVLPSIAVNGRPRRSWNGFIGRGKVNVYRIVPRAEAGVDEEMKSGVPDDDGLIDMSAPDPRRALEKFAVRDSGKYQCRSCGYVYDQATGDPSYPVPPGVEFSKLPEDWRCSTCGAAKSYFSSKGVEVAGFAANQNFGLGTNTLTAGQKSILIYGSLLFFFLLFLSGYFLQ